jgi:DNA polymerase-3 subunit epsilon
MKNLAFIDVETTGCSPLRDRIIEIGILRVENNTVVGTYSSLVNPETYLSPFISSMTGITEQELEKAPTFYSLKDDIYDLLKDCIFVAHNARFDYGFIKEEMKRVGTSYQAKQLCTAKLSRNLFPEYRRHNLDSIIERFGFECANRHRAFDDAHVMWDFFKQVNILFPQDVVNKTIDKVMKKPSLPLNISEEQISNLPESSGVYIFYDRENMPLYIGKSINLKDRVLSHFAENHTSSKEIKISKDICSIETFKTTGELGALLLESTLIKKMQPLHNRLLRNAYKLIVLKSALTDDGYKRLYWETLNTIDTESLENVMAVFKNEKQAKEFLRGLSDFYFLCDKLTGLEKTSTGCFSYKLGKCKGACIKKENPTFYNLRFDEAFFKTKIKKWPYDGPIIIKEKDTEKEVGYVLDNWCYKGTVNVFDQEISYNHNDDLLFDYDTYKILNRFLANPKNRRSVMLMKDMTKYENNYM